MGKITIDQCDMCEDVLQSPQSGLVIQGQDIKTFWAGGKGSGLEDPFQNSGSHAPMQGQISLTICNNCLISNLRLTDPLRKVVIR